MQDAYADMHIVVSGQQSSIVQETLVEGIWNAANMQVEVACAVLIGRI